MLSRQGDGPFAIADIQRIRLLDALEDSGIDPEALGEAVRDGALSMQFVDAVFPEPVALSSRTVREVAFDAGLPLELVRYLYTMWGLPVPDPDEPMREDDVRLWSMLALMPPEGLNERLMTGANRLFSEGMRKVVVSCLQYFRDSVEQPLRDSDMPASEALTVLGQQANALLPLAYGISDWGLHRFMERALLEYFVDIVEEVAEEQGLSRERESAPPAIAFLDLTGFSVLSERKGDAEAAELAVALARLVQETTQRSGGRLVKLLGDGAMLYFPDPEQALVAGLELVERVPGTGLPSARMGISAGPVVSKDGDYFGRTVNLAARVADYARPGEVLIEGFEAPDWVEDSPIGAVELKGASGLVTLRSVRRADRRPTGRFGPG